MASRPITSSGWDGRKRTRDPAWPACRKRRLALLWCVASGSMHVSVDFAGRPASRYSPTTAAAGVTATAPEPSRPPAAANVLNNWPVTSSGTSSPNSAASARASRSAGEISLVSSM